MRTQEETSCFLEKFQQITYLQPFCANKNEAGNLYKNCQISLFERDTPKYTLCVCVCVCVCVYTEIFLCLEVWILEFISDTAS
jgi:hypothetical protein